MNSAPKPRENAEIAELCGNGS